MSHRVYGTSRTIRAGCFSCWGSMAHWTGANAQGVAARHHDATGHQTWVDVVLSITYGRTSSTPNPKQLSLPDTPLPSRRASSRRRSR